ncbi:MAG TPA: class I SAM-dependent methyltransferase [Flavisolibacter sp.]
MNGNTHSDPVGASTLEIISKASRLNKWMYDTIRPFIKGEVLEVGSGIGNISQYLVRAGYSITLSDYNPEYRRKLEPVMAPYKNVREIISIDLQEDQYELKYQQYREKFDTVFLLNVIEHINDDMKAVEICRFLLKPGGHLIVLAPAFQTLFSRLDTELGHFRRYTVKSLSAVIEKNYLTVIHKRYLNLLGISGWLVSGKILHHRSLQRGEMNLFNRLVPLARLMDKLVFNRIGLSAVVVAKKD